MTDISLKGDQIVLAGPEAGVIFDIGSQHGDTTKEYLDLFKQAQVIAIEPEPENFARTQEMIRPYGARAQAHQVAIWRETGKISLNVNSHSGTHSVYELGAENNFKEATQKVGSIDVPCFTLDDFCAKEGWTSINIVRADLQGAELDMLKGATKLLEQRAIQVLVVEVEFRPLYQDQPLFWEIGAFLQRYGYNLFKLYEPVYHASNGNVLLWSDAVFLSPDLTRT